MNVNKVLTRDYENKPNWTLGENEPKTNPIKANFTSVGNAKNAKKLIIDKCVKMGENLIGVVKFVIMS